MIPSCQSVDQPSPDDAADGVKGLRSMATGCATRICLVDDDPDVLDSMKALLETQGFEVSAYHSGAALLADDRRPSLRFLVVDYHMPKMDGLALVEALRRRGVVLPTILITGRIDAGIARHATDLGIVAVLEKPFPTARLVELIRAGYDQS